MKLKDKLVAIADGVMENVIDIVGVFTKYSVKIVTLLFMYFLLVIYL